MVSLSDLKIGVSGGIIPPLDNGLRTVKRNEERGFDSFWWPDHLMGWHPDSIWTEEFTALARYQRNPHVYPDPIAMIAAASQVTERAQLGIVVTDVLRRHPAVLAEALLTLDHLSKGRAILGLGSGERLNIAPYGIDFYQAVAKLEEGIEIIRRLMATGGPIDYDGRFWRLRDAVLGYRPYGDTPPPIWVAAHGPRMLKLTGRLADGWIPTKVPAEDYGEKLGVIRRAAAGAGRDPDAIVPSMLTYVAIDEDHEVCHRMFETVIVKALCLLYPAETYKQLGFEPPFGEDSSGFHDYVPVQYDREAALRVINRVPREIVEYHTLHGTPEEVAAELEEYFRQGLRHVVLWNIAPFADASRTKSSFTGIERVLKLVKGVGARR